MKSLILILSAVVLIAGTSCKSKEKSGDSSTSSANNSKTANSNSNMNKKARLVVSFNSIGTGVDRDAVAKMEKFVKEHPKKPKYDVYTWGREGETDYTFSLSEIKSADQAQFIADLKAAIGDSDRVSYKENEAPSGKLRKELKG